MKLKTAFHLLVAALIAFGVVSCGSDNSASSGSLDNTTINTPLTPTTNLLEIMKANPGGGVDSKTQLLSAIANHHFDKASEAGIHSFVKNGQGSSSNSKCKKVLGIPFCYSVNNSGMNTSYINNFYHRRLNANGTIDKNFTMSSDGWGSSGGMVFESAETDDNFNNMLELKNWIYSLVENSSEITADRSRCSSGGYNQYGGYSLKKCKGFKVKVSGWYYYIDLGLPLILNPYRVHQ